MTGAHMKKPHMLIALVLFALAPGACLAARAWLLPSQTIVARAGGWVTFDAANSDDLFSFNQGAMPVDQLSVTGPDGKPSRHKTSPRGKPVPASTSSCARPAPIASPWPATR